MAIKKILISQNVPANTSAYDGLKANFGVESNSFLFLR